MRNKREPRVLIVDDNELNRTIVLRLFSIIGLHAEAVDSGEKALEVYETKQYDLIMMDLRMPVMNGIETTRKMRKLESCSEYSDSEPAKSIIIGMSAESSSTLDTTEYLKAGMDDCIAKPIRLDYLKELIAKMEDSDSHSLDSARSENKSESSSPINFKQAAVFLQQASPESVALYKNFKDQMVENIGRLEANINDDGYDELLLMTHEFKGAVVLFGFTAFCEHLKSIEHCAQANDISRVQSLVREAATVFEQCCLAVEKNYNITYH